MSRPLFYFGVGGFEAQNLKILAGQSHTFTTPDNLQATRYWPKMGCNDAGNMCTLGGSGGPSLSPAVWCVRGPGELCDPAAGCAPPVDTKFEATFGQKGLGCNPSTQDSQSDRTVDDGRISQAVTTSILAW